jgi:hypothetical protein
MKSTGISLGSLVVLLVVLAAQAPARAQASDVLFFPETGHTVRGEFLTLYTSVEDPKLLFGYPITEQMTSRDGMTVQYFQRARFELVTDSLRSPQVQLTAIGQSLYEPGAQQNIHNPLACQFFASTGFSVCFQFLDFYRANGGADRFGKPISPFEFHDDVLVQYFEQARFEWRTDGFNGRVVLTDLGRIYFDVLGEDPAQLHPVEPTDATINPVLSIKINAFVSKPVTGSNGDQTVFVLVRSQTNQAVPNANGIATFTLPDGTLQSIKFTTGPRGVGQFSFNFTNQTPGDVLPIEIAVSYQGIHGKTRTSFRIWY